MSKFSNPHDVKRILRRAGQFAMTGLETRVLFAGGGFDPLEFADETIVPGNLQIGAAPNTQYDPYISAGPNGTTLALWSDYRTGGTANLYFGIGNGTQADVWASRIAADGSLIDQVPININHDGWNQTDAKAAWNGSHWLVVWSSEQSPYTNYIHAARLAPDGTLIDAQPILIMDDRFQDQYGNPVDPAGPLDVQPNGDGFVVTWWRTEPDPGGPYGSKKAYYGTRVGADGAVLDPDGKLLASGPYNTTSWIGLQHSPSNGGQFLQVHYVGSTAFFTRRDANLDVLGSQSLGSLHLDGFYNEMAGSPSGWMIATRNASAGSVHALLVDAAGTPAPQQTVATGLLDPRVGGAWDGNSYVVTYTNFTASDDEVLNRRIAPDGTMAAPVVVHTLNNPVYDVSTIGHDGGRYSVLFQDSSNGTTTDIAVINVAPDNTVTSGADVSNAARAHSSPDVASDGTNFLAVFQSFNQDEKVLMGVRLGQTGQPLDAEPFAIVPNSWNPSGYQVVYFGGRYVVTFRGTGPDGTQIYAQQVGSDGQLIGTPVALTTGMSMGDLSVIGDRMLVTGNSNEGSLHSSRRFGRIFDTALAPFTDRFEFGSGFVLSGDVTPVGGRWLATWALKSSHDAPRASIAYNFISTDGTRSGPTGLVSSYPNNGTPTVVSAGENAAEAMIIWSRQDLPPELGGPFYFPNSNEGLISQRIAADGTRIGGLKALIDEPGQSVSPRAHFDGSQYVITWGDSRNFVYPRQEQPDVFAARVAIDGTVIDPGGFPVAATDRPEDSMVAASGNGHTFFVYRQFRFEKPYAAYRITTRLLDDTGAPNANGAPVFDPNGATNGPRGQEVELEFFEKLYGTGGADLALVNTTTGQTVNSSAFNVVERVGTGGMWEYGWVNAGGALPDGNYTATLPQGSVLDKAGNPLATALTVNFRFLNADATGDGRVNLDDFNVLAANFGQSNRTFAQGDFDYDGIVNLSDFNILASRFGAILAVDGTVSGAGSIRLPAFPPPRTTGGTRLSGGATTGDEDAGLSELG